MQGFTACVHYPEPMEVPIQYNTIQRGKGYTLVIVLSMDSLSLDEGSPTCNVLSNLPGRRIAGSMISVKQHHTDICLDD